MPAYLWTKLEFCPEALNSQGHVVGFRFSPFPRAVLYDGAPEIEMVSSVGPREMFGES